MAFALLGTVQITLIATITVITVALPAIQRDLRVDDAGMVLVSSAPCRTTPKPNSAFGKNQSG